MRDNDSAFTFGTGAMLALLVGALPLVLAGAALLAFVPPKMFQGLTKGEGIFGTLGVTGTGGLLIGVGLALVALALLKGPGLAAARRDLVEMLRPSVDNAERFVWGLTGLVVLVVGVLAYLGPLKSEITEAMVAASSKNLNAGNAWMAQRKVVFQPSRFEAPRRETRAAQGGGAPAGGGASTTEASEETVTYQPQLDRENERLRLQPPPLTPGLQPTVYIAADAYEKYRYSIDDAISVVSDIPSEEVDYGGQPALLLPELPENHPLAVNLGLQSRDIIVSVNERPVGKDMATARQLYEELKNERSFRVVIDRGGQRFTVPYEVR